VQWKALLHAAARGCHRERKRERGEVNKKKKQISEQTHRPLSNILFCGCGRGRGEVEKVSLSLSLSLPAGGRSMCEIWFSRFQERKAGERRKLLFSPEGSASSLERE